MCLWLNVQTTNYSPNRIRHIVFRNALFTTLVLVYNYTIPNHTIFMFFFFIKHVQKTKKQKKNKLTECGESIKVITLYSVFNIAFCRETFDRYFINIFNFVQSYRDI